jgi:putative copper resistance protein D
VIVVAVVAGFAYGVGVRRLRGRRRWPVARTLAMGAAVVAAAVAAAVGDDTFTRHMVEHVLLGMVVPFVVASSAPVTLALQAGGPATRRGLRRVLQGPAGALLAKPAFGFCLFGAGLVALYLTPLLEASATNEAVHLAVHAHLVLSGLAFLVPLVGTDRLPHPIPYGARLLVVLLAVPFHAFLGVILLTADDPLAPDAYPSLDDQRTAAGILWASGELLTLAVAAVVFVRWWRAEERAPVRSPPCPT